MPQSVIAFLESRKDFDSVDMEKRDILSLYRSDIMKIDAKYRSKVIAIFDQIPGLLSQHEKRVVFHNIAAGSKAEQYEDIFFWLSDSMISNECFMCNDPNIGISINENRTYVKCYLGDTGLLVSHAFDENELLEDEVYKQILGDKLNMNEGMLYENAIAQMLTSSGHKLYFYTHYNPDKHRNDIEIDFLISNNSKLKYKMYPIEVKSGKKYSIESLKRFKEKFSERIGECYVIHPRNLSFLVYQYSLIVNRFLQNSNEVISPFLARKSFLIFEKLTNSFNAVAVATNPNFKNLPKLRFVSTPVCLSNWYCITAFLAIKFSGEAYGIATAAVSFFRKKHGRKFETKAFNIPFLFFVFGKNSVSSLFHSSNSANCTSFMVL